MKKLLIKLIVVMLILCGCAPIAQIENPASPIPQETDAIANAPSIEDPQDQPAITVLSPSPLPEGTPSYTPVLSMPKVPQEWVVVRNEVDPETYGSIWDRDTPYIWVQPDESCELRYIRYEGVEDVTLRLYVNYLRDELHYHHLLQVEFADGTLLERDFLTPESLGNIGGELSAADFDDDGTEEIVVGLVYYYTTGDAGETHVLKVSKDELKLLLITLPDYFHLEEKYPETYAPFQNTQHIWRDSPATPKKVGNVILLCVSYGEKLYYTLTAEGFVLYDTK